MKKLIAVIAGVLVLAGCGADGKPVKPTYSTKTTIGYNSVTGAFNRTVIGFEFGT